MAVSRSKPSGRRATPNLHESSRVNDCRNARASTWRIVSRSSWTYLDSTAMVALLPTSFRKRNSKDCSLLEIDGLFSVTGPLRRNRFEGALDGDWKIAKKSRWRFSTSTRDTERTESIEISKNNGQSTVALHCQLHIGYRSSFTCCFFPFCSVFLGFLSSRSISFARWMLTLQDFYEQPGTLGCTVLPLLPV